MPDELNDSETNQESDEDDEEDDDDNENSENDTVTLKMLYKSVLNVGITFLNALRKFISI